jgi:phosphatidylinositol alpha 1,6-mannosyltransferase
MRVAVVSESFLPTVNGVTTSVRQVLDHLAANGHEAIVIAPDAGAPQQYAGFAVYQVPAFAYRQFPVGLPNPQVQRLLGDFKPDVLHAASPFLLGAQAITAAGRLGIPSVAVFQTDVAGYARRNRLGAATRVAWRMVKWIHDGADLTLVPSTSSMRDLEDAGVERLVRWGRGVDLDAYHPRNRADPTVQRLRQRLAPNGETIVGYVGRIAPEKQVERLEALRGLPGVRVVVVGNGPALPAVKKKLAGMRVAWLGSLSGRDLAVAYAAFDAFVHTGTEETFGQTVQEAHATGIPVIAPRAGGPIDLVEHGVTGFLYEPTDDAQLRSYVQLMALDPATRSRMGEAGRRSVLGRSWDEVCGELLTHYRAVAARRERQRLSS